MGTTAAPGPVAAPPPSRPRAPRPGAMVGRQHELARLAAAWDGAVAGRGGIVLVEGAAGLGKSRLAAEMLAVAERAGARVALGHALDIEEGPPFGPWADALRQLVRATPAPPAAAAWPEDLARLCPAVEAAWGRHPGPAASRAQPRARQPLRGRRRGAGLGLERVAGAGRAGGRPPCRSLEPGPAGPSGAAPPGLPHAAAADPAQRGRRGRRGPHARRPRASRRDPRRDPPGRPLRGRRPGARPPRGAGARRGGRGRGRRALGRQPAVRAARRAGGGGGGGPRGGPARHRARSAGAAVASGARAGGGRRRGRARPERPRGGRPDRRRAPGRGGGGGGGGGAAGPRTPGSRSPSPTIW